ncbi:endonuclease domain-containing protein [Gordonia malaquae]|nr:DUF559 domain-containing protein [Gordonia malaquae]
MPSTRCQSPCSAVGCLPLDEWVAVCDSYLNSTGTESIVRVRLRSAGFDVVVQPPVEGVGHADLRVGRLLIECDSVLHHASRADYERDHHRDRRAVVDGWLVLRLTYDDILYDWDGVLADILSITRPDRHRARTPQAIEMVRKSVLQSQLEGNIGLLQFGVVDRTCPLAGWRGRPVARASWWCGRL